MKTFKNIRLTEYSPGAGWACKIPPQDLTQVLSKLNILNNNQSESGFENFDDCAVYKISDSQSIIQTVDFLMVKICKESSFQIQIFHLQVLSKLILTKVSWWIQF